MVNSAYDSNFADKVCLVIVKAIDHAFVKYFVVGGNDYGLFMDAQNIVQLFTVFVGDDSSGFLKNQLGCCNVDYSASSQVNECIVSSACNIRYFKHNASKNPHSSCIVYQF